MQKGKRSALQSLCGIWSILPGISGSLWQHDITLHSWTTQDQYEKKTFSECFFRVISAYSCYYRQTLTHFFNHSRYRKQIHPQQCYMCTYILFTTVIGMHASELTQCSFVYSACVCSIFLQVSQRSRPSPSQEGLKAGVLQGVWTELGLGQPPALQQVMRDVIGVHVWVGRGSPGQQLPQQDAKRPLKQPQGTCCTDINFLLRKINIYLQAIGGKSLPRETIQIFKFLFRTEH